MPLRTAPAPCATWGCAALDDLRSRAGGQFEHHGGSGQQDERVHRNQGEQGDQARVAKHQAHQGHTNHQRVAERVGQGRAAARRLKPLPGQGGEIQNAERGEVDATGPKFRSSMCTVLMVRNSSAGDSTMKTRLDRSFTALARSIPAARQKPMAMKSTTGTREAMTGEFKTARQKEKEQGQEQQSQRSNAINLIAASAL